MKWFGPSWGASVNFACEEVPVPVGALCTRCERAIEAADRGLVLPHGLRDDGGTAPYHLACILRSVGASPDVEQAARAVDEMKRAVFEAASSMSRVLPPILAAIVEQEARKRIQRSWCLANRVETRARMRAVVSLVMELEKIKRVSIDGAGVGEMLIEDIITGDWQAARVIAKDLRFEDDREDAEARARFATFVSVAETECDHAEKRARGEATEPN